MQLSCENSYSYTPSMNEDGSYLVTRAKSGVLESGKLFVVLKLISSSCLSLFSCLRILKLDLSKGRSIYLIRYLPRN